MKVLVTGATGFAGAWLVDELISHDHEVVEAPPSRILDVTDSDAVARLVDRESPDAVAHLAAVSFSGDARRDPERTFRVNVGGTAAVMDAVRCLPRRPIVLVVGSSEAYGTPQPEDLPLRETASLAPTSTYGLSKLAQEAVAVELAAAYEIPLIVTRAFNHIGPGQRGEFAIPSLARRVAAVSQGRATSIRIGNADVRRDFLDVRDVVRAYRLLLETAEARSLPTLRLVVNVASGRSVSIRAVAEMLERLAGCNADLVVDPDLVRTAEASDIVGDAGLLRNLTGWAPVFTLEDTLAAVLDGLSV